MTLATVYGQKEVIVEGSFKDSSNDGKLIYLKEFTQKDGFSTFDSCVVTNKEYSFKGVTKEQPRMGLVTFIDSLKNIQAVTSVIIEPGKILIEPGDRMMIGGTVKNNDFQSFMDNQHSIYDTLKSMNLTGPTEKSNRLVERLKKINYNFIKDNITNQIGEVLLVSAWDALDESLILDLLSQTKPEFRDGETGTKMKMYLKRGGPIVGEDYLDIKLKNPEGVEFAISDYIGKNKLVLIDFWASWCGPCRREMPSIVDAYKKYKDKGFEIVGISLDENAESWKAMIDRYGMIWPQMSDLGGWKSEAALTYSVTSIPATYLVDQDGKVVAKNLSGSSLLNKLDEILK